MDKKQAAAVIGNMMKDMETPEGGVKAGCIERYQALTVADFSLRNASAPAEPSTGEEGDLLYGIPAIAQYLGIRERQAKHRCATKQIPNFKIGDSVCSRRSDITRWLSAEGSC